MNSSDWNIFIFHITLIFRQRLLAYCQIHEYAYCTYNCDASLWNPRYLNSDCVLQVWAAIRTDSPIQGCNMEGCSLLETRDDRQLQCEQRYSGTTFLTTFRINPWQTRGRQETRGQLKSRHRLLCITDEYIYYFYEYF